MVRDGSLMAAEMADQPPTTAASAPHPMDPWIELGRVYRRLLGTAPTFRETLAGLQSGGSPEFRRRLDAGTDWKAVAGHDWEADGKDLLAWFEDIRACDLGPGIDIIHLELGTTVRGFELSAWRWADRIMLIDDGLIEPDSIRTVSSPGRRHRADELPSGRLAGPPSLRPGGDLANLAVWLLFCSFVPLEAYGEADLQARWGLDREFAVLFGCHDAVFHGGFATPNGWKRPLRIVEAPGHH
jgi:hypothetical protein